MDPGVFAFAPTSRLSPQASHVIADLLLGGWLLVAVGVAALLAYFAWQRARRLGAEVWKHAGLRSGPIFLPGVAQPLEDDPRNDGKGIRPFVELTIEQKGEQRHAKGGPYVVWSETSRSLSERPFELRCEGADRVRVEPSGRIDLIDRLDVTERVGKAGRRRIARIVQGETVWIRGVLSDTGLSGAGPYRAGGTAHRWVLRPAGREPMFISSQPVEDEGLRESRLHRRFAVGYVIVLAICQLVFSDFHALRFDGVPGGARVSSKRTWITRNKNSTTTHYGVTFTYDGGDRPRTVEQETNRTAYGRIFVDDTVAIVYARTRPQVVQLGPMSEIGISIGATLFGFVVAGGLTIFYLIFYAARLPWWRRKKLVETTKGSL